MLIVGMDRCLQRSSKGQAHNDTFLNSSHIQQPRINSFTVELQPSQSTKRGRLF